MSYAHTELVKPLPAARMAPSAILIIIGAAVFGSPDDDGTDWRQRGGPNWDFTIETTGLSDAWPADGPRSLWRRKLCDGSARSVLIGLDPESGDVVWAGDGVILGHPSVLCPVAGLRAVMLRVAGAVTISDGSSCESAAYTPRTPVTDSDGNTYHTVRIGTQVWMAENLKVTNYRDGTAIPNVSDNAKWPHATEGAYCLLESNPLRYKETYGALYNFHAVSNSRGLCPQGWHVPSESECMTLIEHLGGENTAGCRLKDNSSKLWKTEAVLATNDSGFSGLPAGGRGQHGSVGEVGYYATWWSSTPYNASYAWHWGLYPEKPGIRSNPGHKASGFSVRCIKDK